jgi:hypothetical protein
MTFSVPPVVNPKPQLFFCQQTTIDYQQNPNKVGDISDPHVLSLSIRWAIVPLADRPGRPRRRGWRPSKCKSRPLTVYLEDNPQSVVNIN